MLDNFDRHLLGLLQAGFPLTREPYARLGLKLGISGNEVIHRIGELKDKGIVRQIGPVLDGRRLGYQSTLVAMRVKAENVGRAEMAIREHPGVSHGYERDHDFNVWITLSVPPGADIENEIGKLALAAGAQAALALPALRVFKLRAYFGVEGAVPAEDGSDMCLAGAAELSPADRLLIRVLPQDLPLVPEPFAPLAVRSDMDVEDFLVRCQSLLERGVIRRFGAAVSHRSIGYRANAMACWVAANGTVEAAGRKLASLGEVSHCYERKTNPLWRYNLFAMIHGSTRAGCRKIVSQVSVETGLSDSVALFSTREFKKVRIKYLV